MEVRKLAEECKLRKEKYIDASIGVLKNNRHKLITYKIIEEIIKDNINNKTSNYSSILGDEEFNKLMCEWIFKRKLNCYYSSGFMMGATGSLNFAFNKLCKSKKMIISSPYWPNYDLIGKENQIKFSSFKLLDSNQKFNLDRLKSILKIEKGDISLLINDPCSNPLGYSLSINEWENLLKILNEENIDRKITLIIDLAYIDFTLNDYSSVFELLEKNLSKNLDVILCYSFSKSFSLYGYRGGMVIGLFSTKKDNESFVESLKSYIRSTWSSCNNLLTTVFIKLLKSKICKFFMKNRREKNKLILKKRISYFNKLASKYDITHFKFSEGFFVFLKVKEVDKVYSYLLNKNIFVIPFEEGIRISIASINKKEILLILKEINKINTSNESKEKNVY